MAIPYNQGASVSFDGVQLWNLTSVNVDGGSVAMVDTTSTQCRMVGFGNSLRCVLEEHPGNVSMGLCEVTFLGPQVLNVDDVGRLGFLSVYWSGQPVAAWAVLTSWKMTGQVNDIVRGSATFKLTG